MPASLLPAASGAAPSSSGLTERFGGLARLYGAGALPRLAAARVCVVGVGGVGSWVVEGLARSAIGAITMIDLDDVCITNVNRQLPAIEGQIGRPKVEVLAERVLAINPACRIEAVADFFTEASAERLLAPPCDFIVDAIDRMSQKALLIAGARARGRRVLTVGAAGGRRDGTRVRVGDLGEAGGDELLRQVRRRLRREHGYPAGAERGLTHMGIPAVWSDEEPVYPWADGTCSAEPEPGANLRLDCASGFGSAVFVTAAFGLAAAGEIVRQIAAGELDRNAS